VTSQKPLLSLDNRVVTIKTAQSNTIELLRYVFKLTKIETLVIANTIEPFALKETLPCVKHVQLTKFNWYEERAKAFA
jgi:hypothetical protein